MSPDCVEQYATSTDHTEKGPEMQPTQKTEKSRRSRTFQTSGSDGTRTRDLRRDRTDEKAGGSAEVAQTQARPCVVHTPKRRIPRTDVRKEYVPASHAALRDLRARELCHLLRGHDCSHQLDELCQQRYRHLIARMDRLPS